ncbi:ATPase [Heyndrickxia oleronia]|uniref:ATPase n=1 Tax=Heyndrickxia oleronia TaxID=38875 RepID=UPI003F22C6EF
MAITFITLTLQNFKSHRDLTVNFGEQTKITGDNAQGKSSIQEAITWLLYGVDSLGSKLDPTPITYESEGTKVSLLFFIDEKQVLLGRELHKGKTHYYINEVPSKAGSFKEILDQLFDKNLFLSLFNQNYFFTLHWEDQREMLLKYVTAPANKEVLKHMLDEQKKCLEPLLKKHSLNGLEDLHKDNKKKKDKQYIAAQSKTKTLKEQMEHYQPTIPFDSIVAELNPLKRDREEIEKVTDSAGEINGRINVLNAKINNLNKERDQMKKDWDLLKNEKIEDHCGVCKQPLQEESLQSVRDEHEQRKDNFKKIFHQIVEDRKKLEEELKTLEYIDVTEQIEKVREIQSKIDPLEKELSKHKDYKLFQEQVQQAEKEEKELLSSLNESIFILDTIKAFRAKEAELQAEKVQALFDTLSIRLFEKQKNGELKNTFEIEMDGKPYRKLSLSESIRAGLELREVLSKQSEVITPVFIDNAESITSFKQPSGQLIISRVEAEKELTIEKDDY